MMVASDDKEPFIVETDGSNLSFLVILSLPIPTAISNYSFKNDRCIEV